MVAWYGRNGRLDWCFRLVNHTFVWFILVGEWLLGMVVSTFVATTRVSSSRW